MGQGQSRTSYQYAPLEPQDRHIRLLTLLPSRNFNATIECYIEPHSLNWNPPYDALSYTWGKPSDICQTPILFNGHKRWVSSNLEDALRHIRYHYDPRVLWIDALCINQADLTEKSTQIAIMGSIFEAARDVIIWLGPKSEDSDLAMTTISKLQSAPDVLKITEWQWRALNNLFGRPWFSRMWVLPEFKRGRNLYFVCGQSSFNWDTSCTALGRFWAENSGYELEDKVKLLGGYDLENKVKLLGGELGKVISMASTRVCLPREANTDAQKSAENLVKMLRIYGNHEATVPHDKIYGLLSLTDAFHFYGANPPAIDYSRSISEVFTNWSKFLIETQNSFDLLHLSQRIENNKSWLSRALEGFVADSNNDSLPSWVPDWRSTHLDNNTIIPLDVFQDCFKCAVITIGQKRTSSTRNEEISEGKKAVEPNIDGRSGGEDKPRLFNFSENGRLLFVKGYLVATFTNDFTFLDIENSFITSRLKMMPQHNLLYSVLSMGHKIRDTKVEDFAQIGVSQGRKQFRGLDGSVGLVPKAARHGDVICLLADAEIPFVLRSESEHYRLIGDGYIEFPGKKVEASQLDQKIFTIA